MHSRLRHSTLLQVADKPLTNRTSLSMVVPRHLSQRRIKVLPRKYNPISDGKVYLQVCITICFMIFVVWGVLQALRKKHIKHDDHLFYSFRSHSLLMTKNLLQHQKLMRFSFLERTRGIL